MNRSDTQILKHYAKEAPCLNYQNLTSLLVKLADDKSAIQNIAGDLTAKTQSTLATLKGMLNRENWNSTFLVTASRFLTERLTHSQPSKKDRRSGVPP